MIQHVDDLFKKFPNFGEIKFWNAKVHKYQIGPCETGKFLLTLIETIKQF